MRKPQKTNRSGFTLVEILITVVVLAVLAVLVIPRILPMVHRAMRVEGTYTLGAIRRAELLVHQMSGRFVQAEDYPAIESALDLLIKDHFYNYKVVEASEADFLALAVPNWPYSQWLEEMAINKDGFITSPTGSEGYGGWSPGGGGTTGSFGSGGSSGGGSSGGGGSAGGGGGGIGGGTLIPIGQGNSIPLPDNITYSVTVLSPTGIRVIPNDGWITIGWNGFIDVSGYQVYRSDSEDGPYVPLDFFARNIAGDTVWADQVENGRTYCYKIKAVARTTIGTFESALSEPPNCTQGSADSPYSQKAASASDTLADADVNILSVDGVPDSDTLIQALINGDIPLLFGYGSGLVNALAWFDPRTTTIGFDITQYGKPVEVLATLLAHEMTHYIWDQDYDAYLAGSIPAPALGTPPDGSIRSENSIDQEYRSFLSMSQVWHSIKGSLIDPSLDRAESYVLYPDGTLKPEDAAKQQIRQTYAGIVDNEY